MEIRDINNNVIYKGNHKTIKEALDYCNKNNISLEGACLDSEDLIKEGLQNADLEGIYIRSIRPSFKK